MKHSGVKARVLLGLTLVASMSSVALTAASATPPGTIGSYPTWNISGVANSFSGTAEFTSPTLTGLSIQTDSVAQSVATGASSYLGSNTGFGQEYGSSRAQPYLSLRPKTGGPAPIPPSTTTPPPSTTSITVPGVAPGWGFALGDIDADWVFVTAYDSTDTVLDQSTLGEQATGNFCENASPQPSSCSGVTTYDVPHWTGASPTESSFGINWAPGTVYGNGPDTTGAYIWFMPGPSVAKITLLYGALSGSPSFQLWLAQPAPLTTITGKVEIPTNGPGAPVPTGTVVQLNDADGTPVRSINNNHFTVPVDPAGNYSIETEQRAEYQLTVVPPPGYVAPAPITVAALTEIVIASPFMLASSSPAVQPTLAATGSSGAPFLWCAIALMLMGGLAVAGAQRLSCSR